MNNNKIARFFRALFIKPINRKGFCKPNECSTLSGKKGNACCSLGYVCPASKNNSCSIYKIRPINCRAFPVNKDDLKLVNNCGYYFE